MKLLLPLLLILGFGACWLTAIVGILCCDLSGKSRWCIVCRWKAKP
jgi:hypothetical protein